jgi:hypothetical protein
MSARFWLATKTEETGTSPESVFSAGPEGPAKILREQFDYLVRHAGSCAAPCADCARFRRIAEILMEPFRSERHYLGRRG